MDGSLRHYFQRDQAWNGNHDASNPPEPPGKPQGQEHHDGMKLESATYNQWLHQLTLDGCKPQITQCHRRDVTQAVESHERNYGQQQQRYRRADIRYEVQYRGNGSPKPGIRHPE